MTGSEEDTTGSLPYPDHMAGSWCAEDAVLTDQQLLDAVSCADFRNQLCDLGIPETAIATNDEESALSTLRDRLEDAGNEGL